MTQSKKIAGRIILLTLAIAAAAGPALAQTRQTRPARVLTAVTEAPDQRFIEPRDYRTHRPVLRIGQDVTVRKDEIVHHIMSIAGQVTVDGRAEDDVVVIGGDVTIGATAVLERSLVVVGGTVRIQPGAVIESDLVVVGGALEAPAGFTPGGEHIVFGAPVLGRWVRDLLPWVSRGLLWGRLIVPSLPWMWVMIGTIFLISLAINHVFDKPVRAAAESVVARPLSTLLMGLLAMLLVGPLFIVSAVSVVGVVILPFVLLVAWTVGKVAVARGLGMSILHPSDPDSRAQSARSLTLGFVAITLAYMVPVLGFITWTFISVLGLGAAVSVIMATFRREYPRRPPVQARPAPPTSTPPSPSSGPEPWAAPAGAAFVATPPAGDVNMQSGMGAPIMAEAGARPFDDGGTAASAVPPVSRPGLLRYPRATFLDRTMAFAVDLMLVAIANNILPFVIYGNTFFLLLLLYHIAFWAWKGTTLGGIICGVYITRTNGEPMQFADAVVRGLTAIFSIAALGLGCFWMIQDKERQMWHDRIAGTYAVKVPREFGDLSDLEI